MLRVRWILLWMAASGLGEAEVLSSQLLTRMVFASCCHEARPVPAWESILRYQPQLFLWMGDAIYGDSADPAVLREKYTKQKNRLSYRAMCQSCHVIGTWDDHDYGKNDAGKEWRIRDASQKEFLDFLDEPVRSARRRQQGVHATYVFGPEGRQVRIILLDTRYFRDRPGSSATLLGESQWQWLEQTLRQSTAQVHLLVSSIQVVADEHRFEKWANFPAERERLIRLLAQPDLPAVVVLSGDRHLAEISRLDDARLGYPLLDVTSSALTQSRGKNSHERNRYRVGENVTQNNFGSLTIDWSQDPPSLTAAIHQEDGTRVRTFSFAAPVKSIPLQKSKEHQ